SPPGDGCLHVPGGVGMDVAGAGLFGAAAVREGGLLTHHFNLYVGFLRQLLDPIRDRACDGESSGTEHKLDRLVVNSGSTWKLHKLRKNLSWKIAHLFLLFLTVT